MLEYATKCKRTDFNSTPKKTWDIVFDIIKGFHCHFKKLAPKPFKGADGNSMTDEASNANVIQQYYQKIFNQENNVDMEKINNIPQKSFNEQLGNTPSYKEITSAIKGMASEKSPDVTGVTTDMLKNLPPEGFALLTKLIQRFWNESNCVFEHRYLNILSLLYK